MHNIQPAKKNGQEFVNIIPTTVMKPGKTLDTLLQYITSKNEVVPKIKPGPFTTDASVYQSPPASGLRVTWLGHSTLFLEIDGLRLLTDPVWSDRVSFVSFAGPKRFFAPPLPLAELPLPDAVLLSHDHYDHLDKPTIRHFASLDVPFYCSLGVGQHLERWGVGKSRITEMNWGDSAVLAQGLTITATPARHFSGRGIINRNQTLWSSFVLKGNKHNIFFGADSGWFPGFQEIGDAFGPFDLTMLEIGAYHENWGDIHMGPENAVNAQLALRGKLMLPIHWGTFNLALHGWKEPVEKLMKFAGEKNVPLLLPKPGQPIDVTGEPFNSHWWEK